MMMLKWLASLLEHAGQKARTDDPVYINKKARMKNNNRF